MVGLLVGVYGFAQATTVTSAFQGNNALTGENAYEWGINIVPPTGDVISSATLTFNDITLTKSGNSQNTGILYADILNGSNSKLTSFSDGDRAGDFFTGSSSPFSAANVSSLGSQSFVLNQKLSWSFTFNTAQLATLNAFLSDGFFAIGLDPDCYYKVGSICFSYDVSPATKIVTTPDMATTVLLLGASLLGLEIFRRRLFPCRVK